MNLITHIKYCLIIINFLAASFIFAEPANRENNWEWACYKGFNEDVNSIAGPDVLDCGFAILDTSRADRRKIKKCAIDAEKQGKAYKLGFFGVSDSIHCIVAIKDTKKKYWSIEYDSDITGGGTEKAKRVLWVSECKKMWLTKGVFGNKGYVEDSDCQENKVLSKMF